MPSVRSSHRRPPRAPGGRRGLRSEGPARSGAPDRYFTRAVGKALELLRCLEAAPGPRRLTDLASAVGLTKPSTFRLLHTLEVERFVGRTPEGLFALQGLTRPLLSARARHELELAAAPHLAELAATTRETVGLAILCDNHLEVVAVLDSPQAVRMGNTVGRILPPHASSLGKAVLSRLAQPERDRLVDAYGLARYTRHTIVDRRQLILDLDRAATRGYALDDEENAVGGVCAGVAICAAGGAPVGAVSVSMPKARWDVAETRALTLAAVQRAAAGITAALGAGARAP